MTVVFKVKNNVPYACRRLDVNRILKLTKEAEKIIDTQSQYDNPKFQRGKELCNRAKKLCYGVEFIQSSQTSEKTPSRK